MTSQILKFVDSSKTQESKYLENETGFLQIKKLSFIINWGLQYDKWQFSSWGNLSASKLILSSAFTARV